MAVEQHRRNSAPRKHRQLGEVPFGRRNQEPIDAVLLENSEILALELSRLVA